MTDITQFNVGNNRVTFTIDDDDFTVKYPERYKFTRPYYDVAKEIPLSMWANKLAFTKDTDCYIDFEVSAERVGFWLWVARRVHLLDHFQGNDDEEPHDFRETNITTGSDPGSLVPTKLPDQEYEGALISQSTGKESIAAKLILRENDIDQQSVFIEYPSRAATHKIDTREEFNEYFGEASTRIWSDFNGLQSTLQEYTDNYEPITCFWEFFYATAELPIAVYDARKYLVLGNELNTGEAYPSWEKDDPPEEEYVAFAEPNQSYLFELAYTNYLSEILDLPIVHSGPTRVFTGYGCRRVVSEYEPEFLDIMHNCLRPNTKRRNCLRCYKCANAWIEMMACGQNPANSDISHDILHENPHLGGESEDWGFVFYRHDRHEQIWEDDGAKDFFNANVLSTLSQENKEAWLEWRGRQEQRVDWDKVDEYRKYNAKFMEKMAKVIPDELVNDMGLPHTDYVPERADPELWLEFAEEWRTYLTVDIE